MNRVKIYTTKVCPYCNAAKNLFKKLNVDFEEINLDDDPDLRAKLSMENNGWRTVPMIFINDKFIGGFDDTNKLYKEGTLLKLLGLSE
ncbi:glutaredoxin [Silvanigrella paludirubra]|uniref:Glutaredoxin n=1 Tax=Silvanigrella paludirubra TaxID=2499159 RepID=A0A6N6VVM7_9BACT|nr:glutaredoxin [Silvanigrella paludirubra]KAB8040630.1 glutaredoxin [Silvanigrella paludirubra]